jgi:hypothetical protein
LFALVFVLSFRVVVHRSCSSSRSPSVGPSVSRGCADSACGADPQRERPSSGWRRSAEGEPGTHDVAPSPPVRGSRTVPGHPPIRVRRVPLRAPDVADAGGDIVRAPPSRDRRRRAASPQGA